MSEAPKSDCYLRSASLLSRNRARLLVIDVQEKLVPAIHRSSEIVGNCRDLLEASSLLDVPVYATEQYPGGLGGTVTELAGLIPACPEKKRFSAAEVLDWGLDVDGHSRNQVVICGIEAHVCVMQTALDLLTEGFAVHLPIDAVGSRSVVDHNTAIERMRDCGAVVTTTETAIFELCETADAPEFREISRLIRERSDRLKSAR